MRSRGWTPDAPPRLAVLFGLPPGEIDIPEGEFLAGSSPNADLPISHESVSEQHFRLARRGLRCWVEDAGSREGTYVNGDAIAHRHPLKPGDIVHAGGICLRAGDLSPDARPMVFHGRRSNFIALGRHPITLGRDPLCEAILPAPDIAGRHMRLTLENGAPRVSVITDSGECFLNGHYFEHHELVLGDHLDVGGYSFRFDGRGLRLAEFAAGASLRAVNLGVRLGGNQILEDVNLDLQPGAFVGLIGPTGAGKSTLLAALAGARRPTTGSVFLDGSPLLVRATRSRGEFGWVPQQDILHRELTVEQALGYSALLRLPRDTPPGQRARVVERSAARLGLTPHFQTPIRRLSGGEVKKVSVGMELPGRPRVLFLDEPTSGLDPLAEHTLMRILRELADSGCTVLCSTHHMGSLYLLDQLLVIREGHLVYSGSPQAAPQAFGTKDLTGLFTSPTTVPAPVALETPPPTATPGSRLRRPLPARAPQLPLLLSRQLAQLAADWRNFAILLGQPVLIGLLLLWAVKNTMDDAALTLFFTAVATLWFGCSNGAQTVVSERALYNRERMVGLRPGAYLGAKFLFLSVITMVQSGVLYGIAVVGGEALVGEIAWQAAGLLALSLASCAIGLAISCLARNPLQSVFLVPLLMIPQIVLSGFTIPVSRMAEPVRMAGEAVPLFQVMRIMDTSLLWAKTIDASTIQAHHQAMENLRVVSTIRTGGTFLDSEPALLGLAVLAAWTAGALVVALAFLRFRERES